jgi:hypothetical protein
MGPAGVFKKNLRPPPPMRFKSVEFIQDLQDPPVFEQGMGGDEGRRFTGEILPGVFQVDPVRDEATVGDFMALRDPNFKYGAKPKPKVRLDRQLDIEVDNDDSELEEAIKGIFKSKLPPSPRDHSDSLSRMPPKVPNGPLLRLEKPVYEDEFDDKDSGEEGDDVSTLSSYSESDSVRDASVDLARPAPTSPSKKKNAPPPSTFGRKPKTINEGDEDNEDDVPDDLSVISGLSDDT